MDEDEEYVACSNCGEVVPKNFKFCPHCGRRLFHPQTSPLLLVSAGLYFLNAILLGISFAPHPIFVTILEFGNAFFLIFGVKFAGCICLMLSTVNTIFLIYFLTQSLNFIAIALVITHCIAAYLVAHEWEKLA